MAKKMPTIGKIVSALNVPKIPKAPPTKTASAPTKQTIEIKNVKKLGKTPVKLQKINRFPSPRKSARHTVDGEKF